MNTRLFASTQGTILATFFWGFVGILPLNLQAEELDTTKKKSLIDFGAGG